MTILLIDSGNSRIKWAWAHSGPDWLRHGAVEQGGDALSAAFAALPAPDRIVVSNVAGKAAAQRIEAACALWKLPVEFITAQAGQCGVRNGYERPAQLGSDRWAALIAAWRHEQSACLVVNCGTAITVDALSDQGEFLGGLILPGLELMRRSLIASAAQLESGHGVWREFPRNTADAMHSGAIQAAAGAIRRQYALLEARREHAPTRCILSGGAADELQAHLDLPLLRMDDIVLRGLLIIAREKSK